jgi:hypothetical protein
LVNNLCIAEKINKQGTWIFSLAIDNFGIQLFVVVNKTAIFRKAERDTEMISFTRVFDSLYLFFWRKHHHHPKTFTCRGSNVARF